MESYDVIESITPLFDFPVQYKVIEDYLCTNSNLPGPRANLTLAFKFADCFEKEALSKDLLDLLISWVNISPQEAPTNNRREFLSFCGIVSLGKHYYYANDKIKNLIMNRFKFQVRGLTPPSLEGIRF